MARKKLQGECRTELKDTTGETEAKENPRQTATDEEVIIPVW